MKINEIYYFPIWVYAIIAFLTSCSDPLTPIPPVWDVEANVPIISQSYSMSDLLEKNKSIEISQNENGILILHKNFSIKSIKVGDSLRLKESTYRFSKSLGMLKYDIPEAVSKNISLASSFPQLQNGIYVVNSQSNSTLVDVAVDVRQYFESLTFADGMIVFKLTNNYPIPITFTEPIKIESESGNLITSVILNTTVYPGETETLPPVYLKGLTLTGIMKLSVPIASPGSNGAVVEINRSQTITIQASITNTSILEAIATVPEQESIYEQVISLNDQGIKLQTGDIKSGSLEIILNNYIPVGAEAEVTVQGIKENGPDFHRYVTIEPRSTHNINVDLSGLQLKPLNETELKYVLRIKTLNNGGKTVTLRSTDSVAVIAKLKDLYFHSLIGKIESRTLDFNQTQKIDTKSISNFSGSFSFTGAKMWAVMQNGVAIPIEFLGGEVIGLDSKSGRQAFVTLPRAKISGNAQSTIQFDNQQVLNFLNTFGSFFPDKISIRSSVALNPDNIYGTVLESDSVAGELHIELPLHFSLKDGVFQDTTRITLDKNNRKKFEEVTTGKLHFTFENGFPIGVRVEPEIMDAQYNVLINTNSIHSAPIDIPAAGVDGAGKVTHSSKANLDIQLSADDFKKLVHAQYARIKVIINTQGADPVMIRSTDYVKMRAYATIDLNTKLVIK